MEHLDSVSETAGTMYLIVAELVPWFTKLKSVADDQIAISNSTSGREVVDQLKI